MSAVASPPRFGTRTSYDVISRSESDWASTTGHSWLASAPSHFSGGASHAGEPADPDELTPTKGRTRVASRGASNPRSEPQFTASMADLSPHSRASDLAYSIPGNPGLDAVSVGRAGSSRVPAPGGLFGGVAPSVFGALSPPAGGACLGEADAVAAAAVGEKEEERGRRGATPRTALRCDAGLTDRTVEI